MDKLLENKQFFENIKSVVEVSQQRGCWKASEMTSIGALWTDINNILTHIQENTTKEENSVKEDKLNQSDIK